MRLSGHEGKVRNPNLHLLLHTCAIARIKPADLSLLSRGSVMALAQALRGASASCGALAPLLLRSQALCASQLLVQGPHGGASLSAATAAPAAAATALRSLFTSAPAAAPASEPAEVRVSELIDAHCGAYGSEQQQASPLQVLQPGFRWVQLRLAPVLHDASWLGHMAN